MIRLVPLFAISCLTSFALAQERIPAEDAQKIARILIENAGKLADAQLKTDPDPDKAFGLRKGEHGAMVLPDKKLSADAFSKAGKDPTPAGQFWFRNVTLVVDGKPAASNQLRVVTVTADGKDHSLALFFLGVRKKGNDLELVLFAKEKEPILAVPLTKADVRQELPIEFEAAKGDAEKTGVLTLNLLGKYQAKITIAPQE